MKEEIENLNFIKLKFLFFERVKRQFTHMWSIWKMPMSSIDELFSQFNHKKQIQSEDRFLCHATVMKCLTQILMN